MAFSLNETTILSAINGGGLLSLINSVLSPGYGIYYSASGETVLTPTSFIGVEVQKSATVTTAPIEKGNYGSFNKVTRPAEINVTFAFEGWTGYSGSIPNLTNLTLTSRTDILRLLDVMVDNANTYDIETPDTIYEGYDLVDYGIRTNKDEVTLLIVRATFQAIREMTEVSITNETSRTDQINNENTKANSIVTEKFKGTTSNATVSDLPVIQPAEAISKIRISFSQNTLTQAIKNFLSGVL